MSAILKEMLQNPRLNGLYQSATLTISDKVKELRGAGEKVYNMGLGQSPFPVPGQVVESLKLHAHEKNYLSVKGLPELKEAVAGFHQRQDAIEIRPDQVMIGPGSKELLFLLQLCFDGEILVPSPCWVSYIPQAKILGKKISLIHTKFENKWRITPEQLQQICDQRVDKEKTSLLILNYPGNPDGITYSEQQLKDLAEIARQNHLIILSDEIYGLLHHKGEHISIGKFYPEGTIISGGLSKWCGAGGWRLGTFCFPDDLKWLQEAMAIVASETYTSVSAPIQYAAVTAFKGGEAIEDYLLHCRRILSRIGNQSSDILSESGLNVHPPQGGFYHFVDFEPYRDKLARKGINTSGELCDKLLQESRIAALPGSAFARKKDDLTLRMAYVDFDGARALAGSKLHPPYQELPEDFSNQYCSAPLEAMKKLKNWLVKL